MEKIVAILKSRKLVLFIRAIGIGYFVLLLINYVLLKNTYLNYIFLDNSFLRFIMGLLAFYADFGKWKLRKTVLYFISIAAVLFLIWRVELAQEAHRDAYIKELERKYDKRYQMLMLEQTGQNVRFFNSSLNSLYNIMKYNVNEINKMFSYKLSMVNIY